MVFQIAIQKNLSTCLVLSVMYMHSGIKMEKMCERVIAQLSQRQKSMFFKKNSLLHMPLQEGPRTPFIKNSKSITVSL